MIDIRDNWYDPKRDIEAVRQDDYLDLQEAFVNGVVPGSIDFQDIPSNGIESLDLVGNKVADPFQADRARKALKTTGNPASAPEEPTD